MEERIIKEINALLTQLFSKMHDAGYEWDADKKELKKIEQKSAHIDYVSEIREELLSIEYNAKNINGLTESQWVAIRAAHRLLGEYITKEQKPTVLSEEDDNCLSTIIAEFSKCAGRTVSKDEWMRCNDFLNSLKDKVQPKQEWSEEDENRINRLIAYFEDKESFTAEDDIAYANWLKSLRPQSRWKPSEEQMNNK